MGSIFHLSEAASIAIHSMVVIAGSNQMLNARQVAEQTGFSKNHTAKVLQQLTKNHFLLSARGPGGGFRMGKSVWEVSLLDIYQLIEGELESSRCGFDCDHCPVKTCIFGGLDKRFNEEFQQYMRNTSLGQLIQAPGGRNGAAIPTAGIQTQNVNQMVQA